MKKEHKSGATKGKDWSIENHSEKERKEENKNTR